MVRNPVRWRAACLFWGAERITHLTTPPEPSMRTSAFIPRTSSALSLAALALLSACGGADSPVSSDAAGSTSLSVSFAATGAASVNAAGNAVIVGTANDTMVISKVQLVLEHVKLRKSGVSACPDSMAPSTSRSRSSDDRGCSRLDLGPSLLDLPLSGTSTSPLAVTVPAGTYREIEFELEDVSTSSRSSQAEKDFLTAHPEFRDVSVRVTGTYKGTAFTFLSHAKAEVEFEFEPALVVQTGVNDNVRIDLDLAAWFKTAAGAVIAPTVTNQTAIDQNIISSFSAFGDRDRDGREDSGRGESRGRGRSGDG
jgi:hypothetical protein